MNLDWDFYFDDWLIDKVPDGMEVVVEEHPSGIVMNPPELTCYFGANPIYLYGKGKLFHEALVSPSGIAIFPEFLNRPGFEFVEEISFDVSFDETHDYWGNNVEEKHVGWVNALTFFNNLSKNVYGVEEDGYVGVTTPSSVLRTLTSDDYTLQQQDLSNYQMFASATEMRDNGCLMYLRMDMQHNTDGPLDLISGGYFKATAPGAFITYPGAHEEVLFLKYTFVEVPQLTANVVRNTEFHMLFSTVAEFRAGTVFDFGSTNYSDGMNYGFRLDISTTGVTMIINDGDLNIYEFPFYIDLRFSHKWSILRTGASIVIVVDGTVMSYRDDILDTGAIFENTSKNYISGRHVSERINNEVGDLEEIAFFNARIPEEFMDKYYQEYAPILKKGGVAAIAYENIPASLSYDLTYSKPTEMFIPNFFGGEILKYYMVNSSGQVQVIADEAVSAEYVTGMEPIPNKSLRINTGYKFDSILTGNLEHNVDFYIGTKIPVLTKVTSDTHIPLKIYMKFKIPEWHDKQVKYNIRLVLKSLDKFLWYHFEKFKTGEFV